MTQCSIVLQKGNAESQETERNDSNSREFKAFYSNDINPLPKKTEGKQIKYVPESKLKCCEKRQKGVYEQYVFSLHRA